MTVRTLALLVALVGVLSFVGQQCSNASRCDAAVTERVADTARWAGFLVVAGVFGLLFVVAWIINGWQHRTRVALFLFLLVCNAIIWRSLVLSAVLHRTQLTVWEGFGFWVSCGIVSLWCGRVFYCTWGAPMLNRERC